MNTDSAYTSSLAGGAPTRGSTRFTPGPWRCVEVEFGDYQTGEVAFVVASDCGGAMVGSVANCRLIAAAPDMLETLQWLDSIGGLGGEVHARIRAAIKNAGVQP
jgi:hypothetical protein